MTKTIVRKRYLSLLKKSLLNDLYVTNSVRLLYYAYCVCSGTQLDMRAVTNPQHYIPQMIAHVEHGQEHGQAWYYLHDTAADGTKRQYDLRNYCDFAYSMIGRYRMDNIEYCLDRIREEKIAGDVIETGVCRGGAAIFMRGYFAAYDMPDRVVWAADSFEGLPTPTHEADAGYDLSKDKYPVLAISLEQVQEAFARYELLDEQVRFLKGWFRDTLPTAPIDTLALLRLDGDLYESTMDALLHLYDKVSAGGFIIVDDWGVLEPCRRAVKEFRKTRGITDALVTVDASSVYWRKSGPA